MKLERKIDIKVFILYLLNNVGEPLEFTTVNDIVVQDEFVNYFDFALCFSELLDKGHIVEINNNETTLYTVSDSGRVVLESYEGELLSVIKERALRSALRLIAFNRSGNKIKSTISENDDGYTLSCNITDKKKTLFALEVFLQDKAYAEKFKENFDDRAEVILRGVFSLLSGDVNFIFEE